MNAQTEIAHLHIRKPTAPRFEFSTPTSGRTILKLSHVNGTTHSLLAASDGDKWTHPQTQCTVCSTQRPHKANVKATIGRTNKWRSLCMHVRITSLCWSYLLMKFIWGVRERLDAVMFCSDVAVCSYVRFHQMDIQRFLDVWARVCGDIMFFCSIALSDYIGYMYGAARCPHVIPLVGGLKNLVKKCKTCCFFVFFILDEVWVALTPSWKFKQTCNTAHTRKKNSIHSFNSLFCDTFT